VLESLDDPRALDAALGAIDDPDATVALAGIAVARRYVRGRSGTAAVDRLTCVAVDQQRAESVRVSALRALGDLDRRTVAPLLKALAADPNAAVRAEAAARAGRRRVQSQPGDILQRAAEEAGPADPDTLHSAIVRGGGEAELIALLKIVERARERERRAKGAERAKWSAVRAAAHVALANRGSRLGVYDLRESLETLRDKVPVEFLTALMLVGDSSCLDAIAGAHARSRDVWFRERLADVFRTVAQREKLTRRHGIMKKIQKRWPGALEHLGL
jgi:HEAT repeat protein